MKVRAKFKGVDLKKGFSKGKTYTIDFDIESYYARSKYHDCIKVKMFDHPYSDTNHIYKTMKEFIEEWDIIK